MRAVEERLDTKLFLRTNRSLELTRSGQLLLVKAKRLLNEAAVFSSFAREVRGKVKGNLVIGSSSEPSASRIGLIGRKLLDKHPLITMDLRARPSSGTRQGLKTGELDIGLILGRPIDPDFTYYELSNVTFGIAGPAGWKEKIEQASMSELAAMPWLTPNDYHMAYSIMLRQLFEERGLELNTVVRFDNAVLGRSMLEAGVGLMLMREEHMRQGLEQGLLAIAPVAPIAFPVIMAHVAGRQNDPLISAFVEATSEVWTDLRALPAAA